MVNGFFIKGVFKIKIIKIMMICIIFATSIVFSYQPKTHANSLADVPGYADELFKSVMKGALVVSGAAASAQDTINGNIEVVGDTATTLWNSYSPQMKQAFLDGLSTTADGIVVSGNYIEELLDKLIPVFEKKPVDNGTGVFSGSGLVVNQSSPTSWSYSTREVDGKYVYIDGHNSGFSINISNYSGGRTNVKVTIKGLSYNYTYPAESSISSQISSIRTPYALVSVFNDVLKESGSTRRISLTYAGVDYAQNVPDPMYDQASRWLRDRVNSGTGTTGSLTLGVPNSVPYSNTGKVLTLGVEGLYLPDGKLYDGAINWRLEGQYSDAGTLVLPDIMVNGQPHTVVKTPTGLTAVNPQTGVPVNVNDVVAGGGTVSTIPNELVYIDGVPYFKAASGTLINVLTGEVVGNPPVGEVTTPDATGLWAKLWEWLKSILDVLKGILSAILSLPLKLLELLKALLLALFIPSEGFWSDNMNNLKSLLWGDTIDNLTGELEGLGNASGGTFKDVIVSLMGVKDLVVIDADSVNSVLDYIHKWVRGVFYPFLLIYNINMLYKLIRGTSLVEMTRLSRNKAGD